MSKKSNKDSDKTNQHESSSSASETVERTQTKAETARAASSTMFFLPPEQTQPHNYHKTKEIERRLERLERKVNSNERFARTFAKSITTQALAADAILYILRKSLHEDAEIRDELTATIKEYDKHKFRRWFSGFFGILLWVISVAAAAGVGAFIYWAFSGK